MFVRLAFLLCLLFSSNVRADDFSLLTAFYQTVCEKHAEPVTAEELTVEGLGALSQIDGDLLFANGKEMVYLYYKRRQADLWRKPENPDDIKAWVKIALQAKEAAEKASAKAAEHDFELIEKFMAAAAGSLNDYSHYYSELDPEKDDLPKNIYPFARRMIGDVLYIKIGNFNASTKQNLLSAFKDYPQARAVILDLRGNRGGLLTAAVEVAAAFIDGGIIASVKGRDPASVKYYNAAEKTGYNLPTVVLIDGNTASSAEVVAAALMEQIQAKLVGTGSFGKGSIQEMYSFENGGRLALTTAHFYTPSGQKIDKIGLIPDYCTYQAAENTPTHKPEAFTNLRCGKEDREKSDVDIGLAVSLLK